MADQKPTYEKLVEALEFYAKAWDFKTNKRYGGLEYFPKEDLLNDCGNRANSILTRIRQGGESNG